ncbi:2-dehydropantoate 2-reductase [Marinospirillum celere]|uniref:2-dehydropantoate 2-reductase n=1 Tax=Marinospirillum celere TaxID=1122252 RepID=A0A1I1FUZ8_9GAMM|nr:2-dehydropantoate 2-reductase [Marinospirillum celere]SFC02856.1 2-dehydropantoate 2-reductase [Marinospirillum celere]
MSEPRFCVLGAGSLGLLFASRLARNGQAVTLLVRPEKVSALSLGVTLQESPGSLAKRQFMRVISEPYEQLRIDRLLLTTKAGSAADALKHWQPCLTEDAEVLMLQNGLGSQAEVAELMQPGQTLLAASVTEGAYLESPATVVHAGKGKTRLGRWCGPAKGAAASWVTRLTVAGLEAEKVEPIRPVLWQKLAVNAVINPLTAVHRVENGALAAREFRPQVEGLVEEVLSVFKRLGIPEPEGGLAYRVEQVILATAANRSSMLQDVLAGRPTEIDYITGSLLKVAKPLQLQLPLSEELYQAIKADESK